MKIDICFVLDCTASMGPWISEAKRKTVSIVGDIRARHTDADVSVAFVGYRDYADLNRIEVVDFTTPDSAQQAIQGITAEGGDDEAEDIATALFTALQLNWTGDMKFVVHIADAPAHGSDFNTSSISDRFPRGDPDGRDPRDSVEKFSFLNMDYTFVKISSETSKMIDEFRKCYKQGGTFTVIDLLPQMNNCRENVSFSASVIQHINESITQHTSSQAL